MKNITPSSLGRPPGDHELRKLRSSIWYQAVKSVENLNDCQLDILFGPDNGDGDPRDSCDRIKMFEAIRVNQSIPSSGKKGKRNFDLVARVDASHGDQGYNCYKGTAAIIHSPFWRLLEKKPLSLNEIREMVLQCIINLDLQHEIGYFDVQNPNYLKYVKFDKPELSLDKYFEYQRESDNGYYSAMVSAFKNFEPNLDYITLLGALSFEAIEAGNMTAAANLIKSLSILLKEYCDEDWLGNLGPKLYELTINRIQAVLYKDNLNGSPSYASMLSKLSNANNAVLNSPVAKFLQLHESLVWRKHQ